MSLIRYISFKALFLLVFSQYLGSNAYATQFLMQLSRHAIKNPTFRTNICMTACKGIANFSRSTSNSLTHRRDMINRSFSIIDLRFISTEIGNGRIKFADLKSLTATKVSDTSEVLVPKKVYGGDNEKLDLKQLKGELGDADSVIKIVIEPISLNFLFNGGHRPGDSLPGEASTQIIFLQATSNSSYNKLNIIENAITMGEGYQSSFKTITNEEVQGVVDNLLLLEEYTSESREWNEEQKTLLSLIRDDIHEEDPIKDDLAGSTGQKAKISIQRIDDIDLNSFFPVDN